MEANELAIRLAIRLLCRASVDMRNASVAAMKIAFIKNFPLLMFMMTLGE
jgi:hypothetical protein